MFAISCKTGEYELVGVYHAAYQRGSALNVVVAIDQLAGYLTTLRRPARPAAGALDEHARTLVAQAARPARESFFGVGPLTALVHARDDGALVFQMFSSDFPLKPHAIVVLEDLPPASPGSFGELGRVAFGSVRGLKTYGPGALTGDDRAHVVRLLDVLRQRAIDSGAYVAALRDATGSRERNQDVQRLERALRRSSEGLRYLAQGAGELAERLAPGPGDTPATLASMLAQPAVVAPTP